jgi:hypothetical protein
MAYANKEGVSWLLLCTSKEVTRWPQDSGSCKDKSLDSGFRRNDEL